LTLLLPTVAAQARHSPNEVLVVYNANSPISTAIAKYYIAKRHIKNVVPVRCIDSAVETDSETIPIADYTEQIAAPVSEYLADHKKINFIVLTKGVPIRIDGAATGEGSHGSLQPSLDSYLAALGYPALPGALKANLAGSGTVGTAWINRYYNTNEPFSHRKFGGYLVTRLDGYTQADAIALVERALAAEHDRPQGKVLFDIPSDFGVGDKTKQPLTQPALIVTAEAAWSTWNADMLHASDILEASGIPHSAILTRAFVGDQTDLTGYYSWGSNDSHFSAPAYESLHFVPGSIGDTAVSTGARTFLPTTGGQTLIADLIAHGITCVQGYAGEPILDGTSSPTIDLKHYFAGYTIAESFYAGTAYVGWEGIVIGDPLCCPYARGKVAIPTLAASFSASSPAIKTEPCRESGMDVGFISNGDYTTYDHIDLSHKSQFMVRVASAGPGGNIELHLDRPDGRLIGSCPVAPTGDWQLWQTRTCDLSAKVRGRHTLCLVYTGGAGNLFNVEWLALN